MPTFSPTIALCAMVATFSFTLKFLCASCKCSARLSRRSTYLGCAMRFHRSGLHRRRLFGPNDGQVLGEGRIPRSGKQNSIGRTRLFHRDNPQNFQVVSGRKSLSQPLHHHLNGLASMAL
jgi:hypothetical protein